MRQACTLWDNLTVTHSHSWGYDLITLAEVLWHPTAALRHRTEAIRCHTAAQGQPPQDTLRCWRGAETGLSHCLVVQALWWLQSCASDWELEIQKKGIMCKPTTQNNIGYVCAYYNWLWLYLIIMFKNYYVMNENHVCAVVLKNVPLISYLAASKEFTQ